MFTGQNFITPIDNAMNVALHFRERFKNKNFT